MGNWTSGWFDSSPGLPEVVRPLPGPTATGSIKFATSKLGWLGKDYGIWENTKGADKQLWAWLRHKASTSNPGVSTIEVEDFLRDNSNGGGRGGVHWIAHVVDNPRYDVFHRVVPQNSGNTFSIGGVTIRFSQPWENNGPGPGGRMAEMDDAWYVGHRDHYAKRKQTNTRRGAQTGEEVGEWVTPLGGDILSKWRLHTTATLIDGDQGRGAAAFGQDNSAVGDNCKAGSKGRVELTLEVFATGSAATSWQRVDSATEVPDAAAPGEGPARHRVQRTSAVHKTETTWVDQIEYRLSFRGHVVGAPWVVQGDAHAFNSPGNNGGVHSPFFDAEVVGGWFTRSSTETTTRPSSPGFDPVLALLLSHLVSTEFGVAEIKADLRLNTPTQPPAEPFPAPLPSLLVYTSPVPGFSASWRP